MGWVPPDHLPSHEGYLAGLVERPGNFRELGYPADANEEIVTWVSAACDCGWRSPRWRCEARWYPFAVFALEADEERGRRLWQEHINRGGKT